MFKVFHGELNEETKQIADGHHLHFPPTNPTTGEAEETGVGFPGKDHHTAEENLPMRIAMGTLAFLAIFAGLLQIPHVTHVVGDFLHPTFAVASSSSSPRPTPRRPSSACSSAPRPRSAGIAIATQLWLKNPAAPARLQASLAPLHTLLVNKYYVDEAINLLIVRPFRWLGAVFDRHTERLITQGALVGGGTGIVRLASALVRTAQTGSVRVYAAVVTSVPAPSSSTPW